MKLYGKADETAARIVELFQAGNLPAALAPVFVTAPGDIPSSKWSFSNRLLAAIHGHFDARGFRQWQEVGRNVRKGERAFHILAPMVRTVKDSEGNERPIVYGFRGVPVFGYSQTEGEPVPEYARADSLAASLPFAEVARAWGLSIQVADLRGRGALGYYNATRSLIVVGDENANTWAHELVHAADDRAGNLKRGGAENHARAEVVAELGAATLLTMIGHPHADTGGAWRYIVDQCERTGRPPIGECLACINRIGAAVALIVETAAAIAAQSPAAAA